MLKIAISIDHRGIFFFRIYRSRKPQQPATQPNRPPIQIIGSLALPLFPFPRPHPPTPYPISILASGSPFKRPEPLWNRDRGSTGSDPAVWQPSFARVRSFRISAPRIPSLHGIQKIRPTGFSSHLLSYILSGFSLV